MVEIFKKIGLMQKNYKGEVVLAGAGIIFVLGNIFIWSILILIDYGNKDILIKLIYLTAITGCAGLLDDLKGSNNYRGFIGHLSGLFNGIITTGILKAAAIFMVSFNVIFTSGSKDYIIINVGIIILMAHFHNLLDLRPGRCIKFFSIFVIIALLAKFSFWVYFLPTLIIMIFYSYFELKGKLMLGDTGAYSLGIISGFLTVNIFDFYVKIFIFFFLLLVTLLSERYSFSRYIKKNKVLHWLDMLGRKSKL